MGGIHQEEVSESAHSLLARFSQVFCKFEYMPSLGNQIAWLLLLAIPIACISWTVTHEEVFKEPREFCIRNSQRGRSLLTRKFFYLFTCEYCFSHYVTLAFLVFTRFHLLFPDWRGYLIGGFALVWMANVYMSLFSMIRTDIRKEKLTIEQKEEELNK
jgi:hypothetical protein